MLKDVLAVTSFKGAIVSHFNVTKLLSYVKRKLGRLYGDVSRGTCDKNLYHGFVVVDRPFALDGVKVAQ